jgi:hypothetical protein
LGGEFMTIILDVVFQDGPGLAYDQPGHHRRAAMAKRPDCPYHP